MYRHSKENWVPDFVKRRPDVSMETIEKYLHNLYAVQPEFLYSVSRDFIRNCHTPMRVLPDEVPGHPLRCRLAGPERRDRGISVERARRAKATHDRPRTPFSKGARADARCRAISEAVGR